MSDVEPPLPAERRRDVWRFMDLPVGGVLEGYVRDEPYLRQRASFLKRKTGRVFRVSRGVDRTTVTRVA